MKKSKWFNGAKFVPAHVGVYEVEAFGFGERFQNWNGSFWEFRCPTIEEAYCFTDAESAFQSPTWRGIKK